MKIEKYFEEIDFQVREAYDFANKARALGLDPESKVETPIATTLAEKAAGLVSVIYPQLNDPKLVQRILALEKEYGQLDAAVAFKIAEEIAKEKFCKFESLLQAIDAGIRVGFAYITLGVVSSPIEGFTEIKIGRRQDGKEYLLAFFSGPIRSAGTTASCAVLMLIDYLRETFGFFPYDPTDLEIKRYVAENYDYHERINNLQYLPTEDEIIFLAKNLPIQITGEPTEDREVSNYKDLERIETNFIRGGMCLIFSEGLAQKAQKGLRLLKGVKEKGFISTGWDFLEEYINKFKKKTKGISDKTPTYIKDLVAGRPVFSHPSASGGFRFRYGRSRTGGFSATLVHPATMAVTKNFISSGTQLKIEKPTKGCAVSVCDTIDGPIVKLKNGSVKKLQDFKEAKEIYPKIEEIIYLGDILFPVDDVINRNYELLKPGYVEEWWALELEQKIDEKIKKINPKEVNIETAVKFSKEHLIPLHPNYIYFWSEVLEKDVLDLIDWIAHGAIREGKLVLPFTQTDRERFARGKRTLELIGCEHEVIIEHVLLSEKDTKALLLNFGCEEVSNTLELEQKIDEKIKKIKEAKCQNSLEMINTLSNYKIKDKAGVFIGSRMGRPEKAKLRKLVGSPHVLFPVGQEGGRLRSFQEAILKEVINAEFASYFCDKCKKETIYRVCEDCNNYCIKKESEEESKFTKKTINISHFFEKARKKIGMRTEEIPLVKGVRGTSNADHTVENLAKGILRAKHNINVNKDGTIRYDMTEMSITHFKPKEISVSIEKLKSLGYEKDIHNNLLENEEQILELLPHDVILPACPETLDEKADDVFLNIARFVDEELEKFYNLPKFYNIEKKEDLVGHLVVCIAPHICTATVGRIIGFSKIQVLLASPYMHAAMRRDCDGDEAAAILLMDLLLNFSRKFLPAHRGGTQDAPLVLNTRINAGEVDDQILDVVLGKYPLELYELAEKGKHSSELKIENVRQRLKEGTQPFINVHFTHDCSNINAGVINSSYKTLPTMQEKVAAQMEVCTKIRAVDVQDVARLIIERHFIRDIRGNLRKFSMQGFRCVSCNEKFRRPPLAGKCTKCGGKIIFTISEGSILKYLQPALDLARAYKPGEYLLESLELTEMYIQSIFGKDKDKQEALGKWF